MAIDRLKKKIGKGRHASTIKRDRQNKKRRLRNRPILTAVKTTVKKVRELKSQDALKLAIPIIAKAAQKGIIPKKRASRLISRLTKSVNT